MYNLFYSCITYCTHYNLYDSNESFSVKPDNVQLETSAAYNKVCRGDIISINCSADAVPSEISYQLFENDIIILDASGIWNRPLATAGVLNYTCVANNTLGTGDNASVTITVNGKGDAKNDKILSSRGYRKWIHSMIQLTRTVLQHIVAPDLSFLSWNCLVISMPVICKPEYTINGFTLNILPFPYSVSAIYFYCRKCSN